MSDSKVAALLQLHPHLADLSARELARRCNVSITTILKIMRGETRRVHKGTLDKIADGLGIPRADLAQASLADAGYLQTGSGSSLAQVLTQLPGLSSHDLTVVLGAVAQLQREQLAEAEQARNSTLGAE